MRGTDLSGRFLDSGEIRPTSREDAHRCVKRVLTGGEWNAVTQNPVKSSFPGSGRKKKRWCESMQVLQFFGICTSRCVCLVMKNSDFSPSLKRAFFPQTVKMDSWCRLACVVSQLSVRFSFIRWN